MKNLFSILLFVLIGCQPLQQEELVGLWELQRALRDKMHFTDEITYLQIDDNGIFSVSRTSGDLSGVYQLGETKIHFDGNDKFGWFNGPMKAKRIQDFLFLAGADPQGRRIELKFEKIDKVPTFSEFQDQVVGTWEMFLMMKDGIPEKLPEMQMIIDDLGNYTISDSNGIQDQGQSVINTRHHKVIFERDNTHWDVWFWGKELRLQNKEMGIQYHLRRVG